MREWYVFITAEEHPNPELFYFKQSPLDFTFHVVCRQQTVVWDPSELEGEGSRRRHGGHGNRVPHRVGEGEDVCLV